MKTQTNLCAEETLYKEAKKVFAKFGISFDDAVNIFLTKVTMEEGFPFDLNIPSKELEKRASNLENDRNTQKYKTANELF